MATIEDIARNVEQRAQNCRLDGDAVGGEIARRCLQRIRAAASPAEAAAIEREFYGHAPAWKAAPAPPRGCLGGFFGRSTGTRISSLNDDGEDDDDASSSYNAFGYNQGLAYSMFNNLLRVGGSAAWRNHNPGQIPYDDWAIANGAIGSDNGMAVFPSYEAGRRALAAQIVPSTARSLDPAVQDSLLANIPESVVRDAGIDPATPAAHLTSDQVNHLMDSIENSHGFEAGRTVSRESSDAPAWATGLFAASAAWMAESALANESSSVASSLSSSPEPSALNESSSSDPLPSAAPSEGSGAGEPHRSSDNS